MLAGVREAWDEATHDRLAGMLEPVQEELVARLSPQPGERWLDLTTGVGAVALHAVRAGADVTAVDSSEPILERARAEADDAGLPIRFDVGDVESLSYDDGAFDVAVSNFGVIFVADHASVAAELGRVVRAAGRLGFTAWKPNPKLGELWVDAGSGEELWELFSATSTPIERLPEGLDETRGEEFHGAFVALFESYREGDRVRAPRRYLLALGRRR